MFVAWIAMTVCAYRYLIAFITQAKRTKKKKIIRPKNGVFNWRTGNRWHWQVASGDILILQLLLLTVARQMILYYIHRPFSDDSADVDNCFPVILVLIFEFFSVRRSAKQKRMKRFLFWCYFRPTSDWVGRWTVTTLTTVMILHLTAFANWLKEIN